MPIRKPWDHAIDLKETFKPKKEQLILLSPEEQKEVSDFIDDQLLSYPSFSPSSTLSSGPTPVHYSSRLLDLGYVFTSVSLHPFL